LGAPSNRLKKGAMKWVITIRLSVSLALALSLVLALCPLLHASIQVTVDSDPVVVYDFIFRGGRSFVDFVDPVFKHSVRVEVPRFLSYFSQARIRDELDHYFRHSYSWSERVVLEILHHAVNPDGDLDMCGGASRWLNESVHVCDWTGITCGPFKEAEVSSRLDPFIDSYVPPAYAVTKIDLSQSGLQGSLPSELIQLAHLQYLDLNENSLRGTIPSEYGSFLRLRYFDLGNNQLTGSLPSELGKLSQTLEEMWLDKNRLSGSINCSLTKLSHLTVFDLSDNELAGSLPTQIGHLTSLKRFFLEVNNLTGTLPSEVALLKDLRFMDVGYNNFVGSLPSEMGRLSHLGHFSVESNLLNNTIPLELFKLSNLEVLTLSENFFKGTLPTGDDVISSQYIKKGVKQYGFKWSDFTKMAALAVDSNHLDGTLPPSLFYGLSSSLTRYASSIILTCCCAASFCLTECVPQS
jgi:Leucine-rich repeat (LRR) protein